MIDTVDYEALFRQVRTENEALRLLILKIKNSTPTIYDGLKENFQSFYSDSKNRAILKSVAIFLVVMLILQSITAIASITFRRFTHEK